MNLNKFAKRFYVHQVDHAPSLCLNPFVWIYNFLKQCWSFSTVQQTGNVYIFTDKINCCVHLLCSSTQIMLLTSLLSSSYKSAAYHFSTFYPEAVMVYQLVPLGVKHMYVLFSVRTPFLYLSISFVLYFYYLLAPCGGNNNSAPREHSSTKAIKPFYSVKHTC